MGTGALAGAAEAGWMSAAGLCNESMGRGRAGAGSTSWPPGGAHEGQSPGESQQVVFPAPARKGLYLDIYTYVDCLTENRSTHALLRK